ncbi:MAG: cbb3-type cytochrome c oxidase subunit I, partial [Myxococcaceae bacterium]
TTLTLIISVPAEVLFLNWLRTIYKGSIRLTVPMLFALGMVFVFGLGGLTGLYLGAAAPDIYLHDTMFVVGHFHFTMAAASFLASLAGLYFWYPKMFGRMMNATLGKIHFWFSVIGITAVFSGQLLVGYAGQNRRLWNPYNYDLFKPLHGLNQYTSYFAFVLFFAQALFVWNFLYSMVRGKKAEANPWQVGTLEWSIPSPAPTHNYDAIPVVQRGPHELSNPELVRKLGRDWVGQAEVVPDEPGATRMAQGAT